MTQYLLQYRHNNDKHWSIVTGEATSESLFLEKEISGTTLRECEWVVHEVVRSTDKREYYRSGMIDSILPEQ